MPARDVPDVAHDLLLRLLLWAADRAPAEIFSSLERCRRYVRAAAARRAVHHLRGEARRGC